MNPLFPCDHGAATHSCIMHDTGRGTLCKNANGCRDGTGEIQDCGDMWPVSQQSHQWCSQEKPVGFYLATITYMTLCER